MYQKQKIQLLAAVFMPSAIIFLALISLFFARQLLWVIHWTYLLPLIFIILCFCFPMGRWRIGNSDAKPHHSFIRWFFTVISIECLAGLLFYGQYQVLFRHAILSQAANVSSNSFYSLTSSLFFNRGLFPWSLLAAMAIIFMTASYRYSKYWPFSALLTTKKRSALFFQYSVRIIIAIYLRFTFRFFIALNVVIASLLIALLIRPTFQVYQPVSGMFVGILLFYLYYRADSQRVMSLVEKQKLSLGIFGIFLIVLIAILIMIADYVVNYWIMPRSHLANPTFLLHFFQSFISVKLAWRLWSWEWWILAIPFFASWLGHVSYGRKIYSFILVVLALPVVLWIAAQLEFLSSFHEVFQPSALFILLGLIGQVCFFGFLCSRAAISYAWLGFMPITKLEKARTTGINQLWLVVIGILVIAMMTEIQSLQWLVMLLAIPCIIVFVANMVAIFFHEKG